MRRHLKLFTFLMLILRGVHSVVRVNCGHLKHVGPVFWYRHVSGDKNRFPRSTYVDCNKGCGATHTQYEPKHDAWKRSLLTILSDSKRWRHLPLPILCLQEHQFYFRKTELSKNKTSRVWGFV